MSRNGFPECEREYNRREEAVEMARESRTDRQEPPGLRYKATVLWDDKTTVHEGVYKGTSMSDTPRTDEIWGSMHGSGYQMMLLAQKLERELAALQKESGTAIRRTGREIAYREMAEVEADKWLRLCTEWSEANVKLILRAEQAEAELATCKADADRYRWLRDMNNDEAAVKLFSAWCGQNLDENIDAAIKGSAT